MPCEPLADHDVCVRHRHSHSFRDVSIDDMVVARRKPNVPFYSARTLGRRVVDALRRALRPKVWYS